MRLITDWGVNEKSCKCRKSSSISDSSANISISLCPGSVWVCMCTVPQDVAVKRKTTKHSFLWREKLQRVHEPTSQYSVSSDSSCSRRGLKTVLSPWITTHHQAHLTHVNMSTWTVELLLPLCTALWDGAAPLTLIPLSLQVHSYRTAVRVFHWFFSASACSRSHSTSLWPDETHSCDGTSSGGTLQQSSS